MELADYVMNQNVTGRYEVNNEYWMDAPVGQGASTN